jgi:hypothetical protein
MEMKHVTEEPAVITVMLTFINPFDRFDINEKLQLIRYQNEMPTNSGVGVIMSWYASHISHFDHYHHHHHHHHLFIIQILRRANQENFEIGNWKFFFRDPLNCDTSGLV